MSRFIIIVFIAVSLAACKKGVYTNDAISFDEYSRVYFINLGPLLPIVDGKPVPKLEQKFIIMPGQHKLSLYDSKLNITGDTITFDIKPKADTLYTLNTGDPAIPPLLLRNTQLTEPLPDTPYVKFKLANLAWDSLGKEPINMVIEHYYFREPLKTMRKDTIYNITTTFPDDYSQTRFVKTPLSAVSYSTIRLRFYKAGSWEFISSANIGFGLSVTNKAANVKTLFLTVNRMNNPFRIAITQLF